jgi:hypothetical protein
MPYNSHYIGAYESVECFNNCKDQNRVNILAERMRIAYNFKCVKFIQTFFAGLMLGNILGILHRNITESKS